MGGMSQGVPSSRTQFHLQQTLHSHQFALANVLIAHASPSASTSRLLVQSHRALQKDALPKE